MDDKVSKAKAIFWPNDHMEKTIPEMEKKANKDMIMMSPKSNLILK